jgi:hypothetical protein
VAFEDKYLNTVVGTIVRINERTASIDPGDATEWRVGLGLLRHVLDISSEAPAEPTMPRHRAALRRP